MGKKNRTKVIALGDQPEMARFMGLFLKRTCGDKVKKPTTGSEALKHCKEDPPDLIICMWWWLRDMSVVEFAQRLRETPGCEDVPIIVSDMRSTPQWRDTLRAAGVNGYIPAPARPNDVLKAREAVMQGETYNL